MRETDIRPSELMDKKKPALEHDIEFLRQASPGFESVNCPACQSLNSNFWASKDVFKYEICEDCETVYMNPRPSEDTLKAFYTQSKNYEFWAKHIFPATEKSRKARIFVPRAERLAELWGKYGNSEAKAKMMEVGAAYGTFCEASKEMGCFDEVVAVEPTPDLAERCRSKGLTTIEATIEEVSGIAESSFDIVASFEVIEHLASPTAFIEKVGKFLKPGGLLVCSCPNGRSLGMLEVGALGREVDHEHLTYFNPDSLSLAMERFGFEVLEVMTPGELDVDLLRNIYEEEKANYEGDLLGGFLNFIITRKDPKLDALFQRFLKDSKLSSHMWIVCRRK